MIITVAAGTTSLQDTEGPGSEGIRTGRTVGHSEQLATIREQQRTAFGNVDSLADAIGAPCARSITQRLDTIERVLIALARVQGIDPDTVS
ncbi:hypothetical protein I1A49_46600 [Streptomyces malaysiensis subsp. malaysiensis]|uniref:Uncharacterized protein n=1 Tax=Streptomyces malaysiensis TaxID=92644 RepID=A0ABX6WLF1_STRMQ|nr:hypothetical protein I1A49_46600 [Streptomyces solisilvae]